MAGRVGIRVVIFEPMPAHCLETSELSYRFSRKSIVLDKIDLRVPEGSIYGFLGPNGAGKTTTLRLLLGLLRKQQGRILFFGRPFEADRIVTWDSAMEIVVVGLIAFVNGVLGLVMKGFISWYSDIRLKEELNRKNFEMELALIKSQISPHFLFNTLNNIDVLIEKDPVLASGYLNKLSDILRFMLYETKTAQIPVGKELGYIEKYIALQRIRVSNPEAIRFSVEGQAGQLMVEPMLFMPFIENAFKHAEKKSDNAILIRFVLGTEKIVFACENKYNPNAPVRPDSDGGRDSDGGLGDSLIRRRLSLLYPGRHTLETDAGDELYKTKLTLTAYAN